MAIKFLEKVGVIQKTVIGIRESDLVIGGVGGRKDIIGRPVCSASRTMKPVYPTFLTKLSLNSWCGRKTNVNQEIWLLISTLELACFVTIHKLLNFTVSHCYLCN